jgi:hypothetical protein
MENILCRNKNQQFLVERENLEFINDVVKKEKMKAALNQIYRSNLCAYKSLNFSHEYRRLVIIPNKWLFKIPNKWLFKISQFPSI